MKILVNTDASIQGNEKLEQHTQIKVQSVLGHLADHITRVEIHLSDENSTKGGNNDKRCLMEARLEGHQPVAVTDEAGSIHQAIDGASEKLKRLLDHTIGRIRDRKIRNQHSDRDIGTEVDTDTDTDTEVDID
jgi:ribosome-associated translation inhibitor RaiA